MTGPLGTFFDNPARSSISRRSVRKSRRKIVEPSMAGKRSRLNDLPRVIGGECAAREDASGWPARDLRVKTRTAEARKALSCWWLELPQKHFLSSFKSLPSLESRLAKGRRCLPGIRSDANPAIDAGHRSSPERTPQRSRKVSEMPSYEEGWHACLKFRRGKGSHFHPILACRRVAGGWARTACSF